MDDTTMTTVQQKEKTTGPLKRLFRKGSKATPIPIAPATYVESDNDFTRARRRVESFSEDYIPKPDRAMLTVVRAVGYALPFLAVAAVGTDIGAFYAKALGAFSSYLMGYGMESGIAALTVILGHQSQKSSGGTSHWVKFGVGVFIWLLASLGSGLTMYILSLIALPATLQGSQLGLITIGFRTGSVMLFDLMSIGILYWRAMTLKRHISNEKQLSQGILEVTQVEIEIQQAQEKAALLREEAAQDIEDKRRKNELVNELYSMMTQKILDDTRRNLLSPPPEDDGRRINRFDRRG